MKYFTSEDDRSKREELLKLFDDWKNLIIEKEDIIFTDDDRKYPAIDYFVTDGFYPGYFNENNIKILFIGREARDVGDRIVSDLEWFGKYSVNALSYWRRILYLVYGIKMKGIREFNDIPYANDIMSEMKKNNNFGFAVMNISKYGNTSITGGKADKKLINRFLTDTEDERNYIAEEIELLSPDIIITANLWDGKISKDKLNKIFIPKNFKKLRYIKHKANLYDYKINDNKTVKLIDLYHFSKPGSDKELFYDPVITLLKRDNFFKNN